ncbi:MAG TPA: 2-oxo acid dehydrogenase subunit E2 [Cytophagaceae bacterium]|jgi:pyruvate dehydrogenase E2 component (dihydrolipoamide acetyltransferase)
MAEVIRMPKMSDTMTDGVISAWHKKVGDSVKSGDVLADVETDKATMELESYEDGTLLFIGPKEKESVPVDGVLAVIGKQGENIESILKDINGTPTPTSAAPAPTKEESKPVQTKEGQGESNNQPADTSNIKAEVIRMPKMSDTMTEGTIVAWHKKVGDKVKSGELLAEVATDKATMELESYEDGTLLYIGVKEGDAVVVDGILAIIGEQDADYKALLGTPASKSAPVQATHKEEAPQVASAPTADKNIQSNDSRTKASPLAKKLAKEKGIDIGAVKGSGEHGRIVKRDVETFVPSAQASPTKSENKAAAPSASPAIGQESFEEVAVSQMRKTIARRLGEIKFSAIEIFLTMEVNMDKAIEARNSINEVAQVKISFNDMIIKAVAAALKSNPKINSSWLGDKIRYNHHVHIGVAVAVEEGLVVPVLRFADSMGLAQISASVKDLAGKAKNKKLQAADMEGSTFTISNLGMFGIEQFTAVINPPNACILAVGGIKQTAVVKNGQLVPGNVMNLTLTCDHRVVDGAIGSAFLQSLKGLLEDPVRILI